MHIENKLLSTVYRRKACPHHADFFGTKSRELSFNSGKPQTEIKSTEILDPYTGASRGGGCRAVSWNFKLTICSGSTPPPPSAKVIPSKFYNLDSRKF